MIKLIIKFIRVILNYILLIVIFLTLLKSISKKTSKNLLNEKKYVSDNLQKLNQPILPSVNFSNDNHILILATSPTQKQIAEFLKISQWSRFKFNLIKIKSVHERKFIFNNLKLNNQFSCYYSLITFESIELLQSIKSNYFINYLVETALKCKIGFLFLDNKPNYEIQSCKLNPFVKNFFKTTKFNREENFLLNPYSHPGQYVEEEIKNTIPLLTCDFNKKVILMNDGSGLRYVIMKIKLENVLSSLILDILEYSSYGRLSLGVERMIQIDIDDIFVGASGLRLKPDDVTSLIEFQDYLNEAFFNESIEKFKFNLGFSGYHYCSGDNDENLGDRLLIGIKKKDLIKINKFFFSRK